MMARLEDLVADDKTAHRTELFPEKIMGVTVIDRHGTLVVEAGKRHTNITARPWGPLTAQAAPRIPECVGDTRFDGSGRARAGARDVAAVVPDRRRNIAQTNIGVKMTVTT
jgi:hypothetical protein